MKNLRVKDIIDWRRFNYLHDRVILLQDNVGDDNIRISICLKNSPRDGEEPRYKYYKIFQNRFYVKPNTYLDENMLSKYEKYGVFYMLSFNQKTNINIDSFLDKIKKDKFEVIDRYDENTYLPRSIDVLLKPVN